MKFSLVNTEGCQMDAVKTNSFAKARKYFVVSYGGKYKIIWADKCGERNERNVRL